VLASTGPGFCGLSSTRLHSLHSASRKETGQGRAGMRAGPRFGDQSDPLPGFRVAASSSEGTASGMLSRRRNGPIMAP
jgi:hypothetical protein